MDESDDFDDGFGGIDDAAFIEAAEKVEKQVLNSSLPTTQEGAFQSDGSSDELNEGCGNQAFPQQQQPRRAISNGTFRQTTLTGRAPLPENVRPSQSQRPSSSNPRPNNLSRASSGMTRYNYPLVQDLAQEPATHHKLDPEAIKTLVYPVNLGLRDYQYNIVQRALFNNVLVALPTGLGKTFIAATVMLNWYRWAPESQLIFLAPTKPLVEQQVDACFNIAGIPKSQTALLTGQTPPRVRAEYWQEKRVFFMTPQTIQNDLSRGLVDPKKVVCIVIDEAHRATGSYSYVEVVKFIRRFNNSFRVLALTATPGSKIETVQEVIDGLGIARVEIRTEESLDIRQYVHQKNIETVVVELSPEMIELQDLFAASLRPFLNELRGKGACHISDPLHLSSYIIHKARGEWMSSQAGRNANAGLKYQILGLFAVLSALAHPLAMLMYHGIRSFYNSIAPVTADIESAGGKTKARLAADPNYKRLMSRTRELMDSPTFSEHPKMEHLVGALLRHFVNSSESDDDETRVMIFSSFRVSADEIVNTLKKHQPTIRPHIFVGQADAKDGTIGMSQKKQQEVIDQFKSGKYNTLVATSIGEEGLDIGGVDLIICYDSSKSPIRMLQRMGRAGRKREGNIIVLLSQGKEEENWAKAKDNYNWIQNQIASGEKFTFRYDQSPRILPRNIVPAVDKQNIVPPIEPPSPVKQRGKKKLPPKKFFMPDGVETGFTKASMIGKARQSVLEESESEEEALEINTELHDLAPNYPDKSSTVGLLNAKEQDELHNNYMSIIGEEDMTIPMPSMDRFPKQQGALTSTHVVGHGKITKCFVKMMNEIIKYEYDMGKLDRLRANFKEEDLAGKLQATPEPTAADGTQPSQTPASKSKQRFVPRAKLGTKRQRPEEGVGSSMSIDETDAPVIDITSSARDSFIVSSSPLSSNVKGEIDIEMGSYNALSEQDRESDPEDLPDAAVLLKRISDKSPRISSRNTIHSSSGRKKKRIVESDDDEDDDE